MNTKECSDTIVEFQYVHLFITLDVHPDLQTSFFSRYTKDIASFANRYTGGKIVSVLEGGYSDRALTSAAMGHAIGMMGESGKVDWWSEPELINVRSPFTTMTDPHEADERSKNQSRGNGMAA